MFDSFDKTFREHFYTCKYIVLTEDFNRSIGLAVNPWRRGESNRYAATLLKEISQEMTNVYPEGFPISELKKETPISYEKALDFYETNKELYSSSASS